MLPMWNLTVTLWINVCVLFLLPKFTVTQCTIYFAQSPEKGTDKARLLARMSKMGKNPLSLPGAVAAEPENYDMMVELEQVLAVNQ